MYVSRLRGLLVGARERMRKKFSNWRQKYKRTLLKRRRYGPSGGTGGHAGVSGVRVLVREHRAVRRFFDVLSFALSLREYSSHTRAFVSTDTNCSSRALLSNFPIFNRYSYAQKKYNPDGAKKPKKKIGAKKKKMLLMKSGMRRPE
jgi:hypothetical protein